MKDQKIIALFWQRSEEAIHAVEAAYGPMCRRIARNMLENEEDVDECINDVWHSLWNAIPPTRPISLRAYIARVTRNLAMKCLTRQNAAKRQAVTVSFHELNDCIPTGMTVEDAVEGRELARLLDAFLDTLDLESRNLFLRRYYFFDSVSAMAQTFHISESKVKTKLHRIRKQLKEYLEKEDIYVG